MNIQFYGCVNETGAVFRTFGVLRLCLIPQCIDTYVWLNMSLAHFPFDDYTSCYQVTYIIFMQLKAFKTQIDRLFF